ncbi:unnamed protein product [Ceratitis capitata]|uniref:(Mediterranean fruit fly) hypothetical protein n=1 Tax=Ceratitis capitata TaxID=7213 RepID=A0A811U7C0_CERCA|nr:unnamed protein product [Ceratitis capitata]
MNIATTMTTVTTTTTNKQKQECDQTRRQSTKYQKSSKRNEKFCLDGSCAAAEVSSSDSSPNTNDNTITTLITYNKNITAITMLFAVTIMLFNKEIELKFSDIDVMQWRLNQ